MNFVDTYQKYWKNGYVLTDLGLAGVDREVFRSLFNPVAEVFRKYPAGDCHLYTFGPGVPILGPELVVNGDGASLDGWTVAQDVGSVTVVGGALSLTKASAGTNTSVRQVLNTVAGKLYRLKYETKSSTGAYNVTCQTSAGYSTAVGSLGFDFVAASNGTALIIEQGTVGPATSVFDNITVKELSGYSNTYSGFVAGNYFDSAGTTHASVDGSVGAVLDAAGSVGADIKPTSGYWQPEAGALITSLSPTAMSFNASPAADCYAGVFVGPAVGEIYRITFTVTGLTSGGVAPVIGWGSVKQYVTANGTYSQNCLVAGNAAIYIYCTSGSTTATVTIGEVRKVTGIHATQSTPGLKPTLRKGIVNLLTYSNDLTNGVWVQQNGAVKTSASSFTTTTADNSCVLQTIPNSATGTTCTFACLLSGSGTINLFGYNGTNGYMGSTQITLTPTPTLYLITISPTVNGSSVFMGNRFGNAATSVNFYGAGLLAGTLTAAQILAAGGIPLTTTAPASSVTGVNYLEFDGIDDRLAIPTIGFTDTLAVVLALNISRADVVQVLFGSDSGGPQIYTTADRAVIFDKNGEGYIAGTPAGGITVGVPAVFTFLLSGGQARIRKNGVDIFSTPSARVFTSTVAHALGAQPSGQYPIKGMVYQALALKSSLTLADVQLLEKQAAAAAGIQL